MCKKSTKNQAVSKLLCIFCYKPIQENPPSDLDDDDTPTLAKRLEICDKFYKQLVYPSNPFETPKKKRDSQVGEGSQLGDDSKSEHTALQWSQDAKGICVDCFYAVNTHTKLFEKVATFQRRLRWQLDKLYNVMKCADKIPARVQDFKNNMTGNKDQESVLKYRSTLFQHCRKKLEDIEKWKKRFNQPAEKSSSCLLSPEIDTTDNTSLHTPAPVTPAPATPAPATPAPATPSSSKKVFVCKRRSAKKSTPQRVQPIRIIDVRSARSTRSQTNQAGTSSEPEEAIPSSSSGSTTTFKCSKCSNSFSSLEALKCHARAKHFVLKEEPHNESGDVEDDTIFQCTVEIVSGSKLEQMELDQYLNNHGNMEEESVGDSENSLSDSDPELRQNYPKLKEIAKGLRPHGFDSDGEANNNQSSSTKRKIPTGRVRGRQRKILRKEVVPRKAKVMGKPVKRKEKNIRSVLCETCGQSFTASSMTEVETKLFQHLKKNRLHGGKAVWKHQCKLCGKLCRFKSTLKYHELKVHTRDTEKLFSCSHCKAKFFRKGYLIRHFETQHPDQIKTVEVRKKNMSNQNAKDGEYDKDMSEGYVEPKLEAVVMEQE